MKRALRGLALILILVLAAGSVLAVEYPKAEFPEREFDFGRIPMPAPVLTHDFPVKNLGQVTLEIVTVSPG